ncbi:uncharacterized protein LOC131429890 [Malaya genurostris]|uniref:uncharacterized protein LOC131429890 n=1 Tax=Malaya genurostris TaxID=325434 RepID=UPI0026F38B69|nr:uncharacterized protein LOC131429890 [Malaya genurostris]XP_058450325.1 uncharacterized protein LOC131429890 [Malaya genurostris]
MDLDYDNIYLNKLPITAATGDSAWNHYALVESTWGDRKILLKIIVFSPIYNTPLSFLSEIDHEVLQQTAIRLEKSLEEFLTETKTALCTDGGASGFSYSVEDNNFVWRKIGGPLTVTYGSVILLRSPCLLSDVLQNSINVQSHLRGVIELRNRILLELKEEHEELLEFQRQQEEDNRLYEIELITKCISILNEKKEVINHMKKQLADDDDEEIGLERQPQHQRPEEIGDCSEGRPVVPIASTTHDTESVGRKSSSVIDFSDSDAFDSPLHEQEELEHNLPKRTKFQLVAPRNTTSTSASSSTVTSKNIDTVGDGIDAYNKDTEELLQNM